MITPVDVGRPSEGRARGGGCSRQIRHRHLFERFEYTPARLSDGTGTEKPYYCYDAEVLILKGLCQAGLVQRALAREGLYPVRAPDGRALASIWVNQLKDSVIGPYHEIVFAFDAARRPDVEVGPGPFGTLANFFGGECLSYLHTLYITSPLSIMWGREMQAFPKHPTPCQVTTRWGREALEFEVAWDELRIVSGQVGNRWGPRAFLGQSLALTRAYGLRRLLRFLLSPVVPMPIVMPASVKAQYGIHCDFMGHLLKGLDPLGIRAWPWLPHDRLELGRGLESRAADGQESAPDLWHEAEFVPAVAVHVPSLQLVVTDAL